MAREEPGRHGIAPGLVIAVLLSWAPLVSILVSPLTWGDKPEQVPTHWTLTGVPDGWDSSTAGLVFCIMFGATLGIACTLVILLNSDDLPRWKAAAGLGIVAWFLGTLTWLWFVMISTSPSAPGAGVAWAGFVYGLIMAGLIALPRHVTPERPPGSSATDIDDEAP